MREIGDEVVKTENPNGISRIIPLEQIKRPCVQPHRISLRFPRRKLCLCNKMRGRQTMSNVDLTGRMDVVVHEQRCKICCD